MIWEDERREIVVERCFKEHVEEQAWGVLSRAAFIGLNVTHLPPPCR